MAESKSNLVPFVVTFLGLAIFAGGTYAVVEAAGGTKVDPAYSNTPNGVTPGAPDFK
ncbi:MAG: hypothetical protein ACXVFV_09570 [Mycobacteriales bacterium]